MRIDKALWCLRVYKTRKLSKDACDKNKVKLNGKDVKSSAGVGPGDILSVRKAAIQYTYQIIDLPKSRVGAKLLFQHVNDLTPKEEIEKAQNIRAENGSYAFHKGRPSKKDLRSLKNFLQSNEENE